MIHGETGTGKELVAQAIHQFSKRSKGPFVVVDCGALPEHLLDSELFGHVKGSFTGAVRDRRGAFEEADGGTLFLDEVAEIPASMQPRLLRARESRTVRRIGESAYRKVDVRFIAATHRDLGKMVNEGAFREDLYFRLAVLQVDVPPLGWREALEASERESERAAAGAAGGAMAGAVAGAASEAGAGSGRAVPPEFLAGTHAAAREAVLRWWMEGYFRALSEKHGGDTKRMAAEADISLSYRWKLMNR